MAANSFCGILMASLHMKEYLYILKNNNMKIVTILFIVGLSAFPVIGLAQIPEIPVSSNQSATTPTAQQAAPVFSPKEIATPIKCGVLNFEIGRECGDGMYRRSYIKCYDDYEPIMGDDSSCKSAEVWNQNAKDACINRCSNNTQSLQPPITPVTPETAAPASEKPLMPAIPETPIPALASTPITPEVFSPAIAATSPNAKCGVNTFKVYNECGAGVYKNVYARCYDGFEVTLGETTSCKPADLWNQYAKETCANRCFSRNGSEAVSMPPRSQPAESTPIIYNTGNDAGGGNRSTPLKPLSPMPAPARWISVCSISDNLMQRYNELIAELQKQEVKSDKTKTEGLTREIGNLKQYIEAQKKVCAENPQTAWQVAAPPIGTENKPSAAIGNKPAEIKPVAMTENIPAAVAIDRCNEAAQWEAKIAYYKKLGNLRDDDLKKEGFSREEIEKILQELSLGIEKVRAQCGGQNNISAMPRGAAITASAFIAETVKPVVVESGQEISVYYKARIEKAVSMKGEEKQIEELKTLRDEIDGLISNLIKSRKELEVSELNALVKEVKISRGEIKADDIAVKTTEKKMLMNIGDRPVSVEPTASQVIIRDKGLEVNAKEVTIKENIMSVGGAEVKMSASEVSEKLGLAPTAIELKEENMKAVYNIKIDERRKLFGFIPLNVQRAVAADAENGNMLSEHLPWYNFLTTK